MPTPLERSIRRPGVRADAGLVGPSGLVRQRSAGTTERLPVVLEPAVPDVDLAEWAAAHRREIDELLLDHRALLFRGFSITTAEQVGELARSASGSELLDCPDESTPRTALAQKVFASTVYPAHQSIALHNEGAYCHRWGTRIYFGCIVAPAADGETPIADVRHVAASIGPAVVAEFARRGVRYVRNFHEGVGLTWQQAFWTDSREVVERYCAENAIAFEWQGERLRTTAVRPAVRRHPVTGERLWFNHAAFFHVETRDEPVQRALLESFGEEGLPFHTYYGDGARIDGEVARAIAAAYRRHKVKFAWERGDVLLLDNMTIAHGREPYAGDRKIVVALTGAGGGADESRV